MGSLKKAYGALKDSTQVGLAKVNSDYKELDVAIVKATNHVEAPPKERHVRKIIYATSSYRPRSDVAYCIHALDKRLSKTRSWIVALKTLIVIHRTLRESDPIFREELAAYSYRGHVLQISNFKDDSSHLAWDCSAWVRTYALFLQERLECFRVLKYDIESERLTKSTPEESKPHSKTRTLGAENLLVQLPALQQLLYRLINCQPEGSAYSNYLVQYALALVLKESFKIYCAINDGIINLVELFFEMARHDAIKGMNIYKRAGQQAENLADLYEYCKGLDLSRNFQFPTLRQPPQSFIATMEDYVKEAPQTRNVTQRLEYQESQQLAIEYHAEETVESEKQEEKVEEGEEVERLLEEADEEPMPKEEKDELPPLLSTDNTGDLLGLYEINPKAAELEENNALALAIVPPGGNHPSNDLSLSNFEGTSGWELALVSTPSNLTSQAVETKLAGGFDKLLLDSLYEDESSRRQLQMQNAGYGTAGFNVQNPMYYQNDPFMMSNSIAPPTNVQMAMMSQQQQMLFQQQQQQQQQNMMMNPRQQHPMQFPSSSNPFGDPFVMDNPQSSMHHQGNHHLI